MIESLGGSARGPLKVLFGGKMDETKVKDVGFKKVFAEARGLMRTLYKAGLIDKATYTAIKIAQKKYKGK